MHSDLALPSPPRDTVTQLVWDDTDELLLASSWDGAAHLYRVIGDQQSALHRYHHPTQKKEALLDISFDLDGRGFFTAGCTGAVWRYDINRPDEPSIIGTHSMPVKACRFNRLTNTVITASWDRTLCVWDGRSPTPVSTTQLTERAYAMDVRGAKLVVATADHRKVDLWDVALAEPRFYEVRNTPLTMAPRCVAISAAEDCYIVGSTEGRCAVQYFADISRNFAFKCHRQTQSGTVHISAVNAIAFSRWNTFATVGSDGGFNFWCQARRQRLKSFPAGSSPVTACAFSSTNDAFAYAVGVDWSAGESQHRKTEIFYHRTTENEIKKQN